MSLIERLLPFSRRGPDPAVAETARVIASLEDLNRATEADFLALGARLAGFLASARRMMTGIRAAGDMVSGEQAERACAALARVLASADEMRRRGSAVAAALDQFRVAAAALRRGFAGYEGAVMSFRVTATLARIETMRLGAAHAAMGDLADHVDTHGKNVQARVLHVLAAAGEVERLVECAIESVSELEAREMRELPPLIADVESRLEVFIARRTQTALAAEALGRKFDALIRSLDEVATSIQIHDITRQQLEHVIEALQPLTGRRRLARQDGVILDLQRAQLVAAGSSFRKASDEIHIALEAIAESARELASGGAQLIGANAAGDTDTFLAGMEHCFAGILQGIARCHNLRSGQQAAAADLRHSVEALRNSVHELQAIEIDIQRLALNARINASHLEAAGEPLNVIAEAMHDISCDCETRSAASAGSVAAIEVALASMAPADATPDADDAALAEELRVRIDELHASNERSASHCRETGASVTVLCDELKAAGSSFTVGAVFARTVADCCGAIDRITAAMGGRPVRADGSEPADLQAVERRYTMQSEREVHESVSLPNEPVMVAAASADGPDDNVELF